MAAVCSSLLSVMMVSQVRSNRYQAVRIPAMQSAAASSCAPVTGRPVIWPARIASDRSASSLRWLVTAAAWAIHCQPPEVMLGDHLARSWLPRIAARSQEALTVIPSHSSATDSSVGSGRSRCGTPADGIARSNSISVAWTGSLPIAGRTVRLRLAASGTLVPGGAAGTGVWCRHDPAAGRGAVPASAQWDAAVLGQARWSAAPGGAWRAGRAGTAR